MGKHLQLADLIMEMIFPSSKNNCQREVLWEDLNQMTWEAGKVLEAAHISRCDFYLCKALVSKSLKLGIYVSRETIPQALLAT